MNELTALTIAAVLLAFNAFFVGAEFAIISVRRTEIEPRAAAGGWAARMTLEAMERVSLMMAGAQLGITICSLGLGAVGEPAVAHLIEPAFAAAGLPEHLLHPVALVIALSVVVFLHVVVGEMVPKNIALAGPDRAALALAPPLLLVVRVLHPAIAVLNGIANLSLRAVHVQPREEVASTFTREEVAGLVEQSRDEGLLDEEEHQLLTGALSFEESSVRSVLVPVDSLVTVRSGVTGREVEELSARTGYSRFPVTSGRGEVVGYLHLKDVLGLDGPVPRSAVRLLGTVRAEQPLSEVLTAMQRQRAHLARVVDADGAVLGVAALEDVLEQLVGEVRDSNQRGR